MCARLKLYNSTVLVRLQKPVSGFQQILISFFLSLHSHLFQLMFGDSLCARC